MCIQNHRYSQETHCLSPSTGILLLNLASSWAGARAIFISSHKGQEDKEAGLRHPEDHSEAPDATTQLDYKISCSAPVIKGQSPEGSSKFPRGKQGANEEES